MSAPEPEVIDLTNIDSDDEEEDDYDVSIPKLSSPENDHILTVCHRHCNAIHRTTTQMWHPLMKMPTRNFTWPSQR